ncbi:MAG: 50S ribosomal protein L11 methyltransferase [Gammaproteobacteria bacterium]|nr:50S ribosomal protein L11 methyltransferase [Gammaproteobacteria bacterium]
MLQISLTIDRAQLASTEQALLDHGACSVTLRDAADDPVLEPRPGEAPVWPTVVVTGLYADNIDTESLQRRLHGMLAGRPPLEITRLAERDWTQVWKHDCATLTFGRRLRVRRGDGPQARHPERDHPVQISSSVDLFLDPGLAFGTGDHPTTALCLQWLDANPPPQLRGDRLWLWLWHPRAGGAETRRAPRIRGGHRPAGALRHARQCRAQRHRDTRAADVLP